jgi:hypothetical protein
MVSAIAIIVSLIYVGFQLRQSTLATRVLTSQTFIESHGGTTNPIIRDSEFRDLYWRGLSGLSNLQGVSSPLSVRGQCTQFGYGNRSTSNGKRVRSRTRSGPDGCVSFATSLVIPAFRRNGKFAAITSAMNSVSLWNARSSARSHIRSTLLTKALTYRDSGELRDSPVLPRAVEAAANELSLLARARPDADEEAGPAGPRSVTRSEKVRSPFT